MHSINITMKCLFSASYHEFAHWWCDCEILMFCINIREKYKYSLVVVEGVFDFGHQSVSAQLLECSQSVTAKWPRFLKHTRLLTSLVGRWYLLDKSHRVHQSFRVVEKMQLLWLHADTEITNCSIVCVPESPVSVLVPFRVKKKKKKNKWKEIQRSLWFRR